MLTERRRPIAVAELVLAPPPPREPGFLPAPQRCPVAVDREPVVDRRQEIWRRHIRRGPFVGADNAASLVNP